jgi:putative transposase
MPFKETTKVKEREEMVGKYESGLYTVSELARIYGVSPPTVRLWISRYEVGEPLDDRPPIPKSCPHRTAEEIEAMLLEAKREKQKWGPRKQRQRLAERYPDIDWPAVSTIGEIYKRHGLVKAKLPRPRRIETRTRDQIAADHAGQMMTADHKGQFRLGNRKYCYPLTIADPISRFIYAIDALTSTSVAEAKRTFTRVFEEHGVPEVILTDNGVPFCCSRAVAGLSPLSVWWIKAGVTPLRIRKGSPWENGVHERMHRTLKDDTARPPAETESEQQVLFDAFRHEYNEERPHEGLGGARPVTLYRPCDRAFDRKRIAADVEYPGHYEVRRVRSDGEIKWKGGRVYISASLVGELAGLVEVDDGVWSIQFADFELAKYDERKQLVC